MEWSGLAAAGAVFAALVLAACGRGSSGTQEVSSAEDSVSEKGSASEKSKASAPLAPADFRQKHQDLSLKIYHISQGAFEKLSAVIKLGDER